MKSKIKKRVFFILLAVMVTVIVMFIASIVWNMVLISSGNIKIVDQAPFPEWNQNDLDYVQTLTGVKLPLGTVLLAYSNNKDRGRHNANWWIFSEKKILFPCELNNDVPYSNQKHLFEEACQKIGKHSDFSIKEDIQSCLSSCNSYAQGQGHDVYVEIKTSKGYYVQIGYCRILPRDLPKQKSNLPVPEKPQGR